MNKKQTKFGVPLEVVHLVWCSAPDGTLKRETDDKRTNRISDSNIPANY
jgi:hypothetical protein